MIGRLVFIAAFVIALEKLPILVWLYVVVGLRLTHLKIAALRAHGAEIPVPLFFWMYGAMYWLPDIVQILEGVYGNAEQEGKGDRAQRTETGPD